MGVVAVSASASAMLVFATMVVPVVRARPVAGPDELPPTDAI
jgi:hypothetical protein